jgi:hypothetical protein
MATGKIELCPISDVQFEAIEYDAEGKARWRERKPTESLRDALGKMQSSQSPDLAQLMAVVGVSDMTADQISRGGVSLQIDSELLNESAERWLRGRPFGRRVFLTIRGASSETPDDESSVLAADAGDVDEPFDSGDEHHHTHPARGASNE